MRSSKFIPVYAALFILLLSMASAALCAESGHPLRAGAAKIDITPTNLHNLNSFGGDFKAVHDPIYARALVLDNGVNTAALVTLDLVESGDTMPVRERIQKELGIPADHIMITSSHDHSAPRIGSVTPGGIAHPATAENLAYTVTVFDKIVAAVKQAKSVLQPAKVGFATGTADLNINRDELIPGRGWGQGYNPDGHSDKTVWVLKIISLDGRPIAIFFDYSSHSTVVLGTGELSGDLGGAAERFVEARFDNKIVALYSMGAAGDQNPKIMQSGGRGPESAAAALPATGTSTSHANAYDSVNAFGLVLGTEVVRVADGIKELSSTARIEAGEKIVSCPIKKGVNQMGDLKQDNVTSMPLHLGLILINDVALTGVSGEVVTNIYWHLKKTSPLVNTVMLTLANDRAGYIADDLSYDTPYFAVNGTPFARGCAEPNIVNGLSAMISEKLQ